MDHVLFTRTLISQRNSDTRKSVTLRIRTFPTTSNTTPIAMTFTNPKTQHCMREGELGRRWSSGIARGALGSAGSRYLARVL